MDTTGVEAKYGVRPRRFSRYRLVAKLTSGDPVIRAEYEASVPTLATFALQTATQSRSPARPHKVHDVMPAFGNRPAID